ncbi:MAG: class I SAM-dependent methyltransferase [Bacteroidota bacterium]|nr:class I SAM-dependent methyltransferase [Bacteroidota bacterium]
MALEHHLDSKLRFTQQVENSQAYVLAFINETKTIQAGLKVLEIGCGEGGVLKPFIDSGCLCVGVDLDQIRIDIANEYFANDISQAKVQFINQDVYEASFVNKFHQYFDVIILKDAIEHIPNQEAFIPHLKQLLAPAGQVFFGFPPWQMPFGGHQQLALNKWTSKLPYYHLLPNFLYKGILRLGGETDGKIGELLEIKSTRISIERFERIIKAAGLTIKNQRHYLINPIYKYKFGLAAREQFSFIKALPFVRNFLTTCVYYSVG